MRGTSSPLDALRSRRSRACRPGPAENSRQGLEQGAQHREVRGARVIAEATVALAGDQLFGVVGRPRRRASFSAAATRSAKSSAPLPLAMPTATPSDRASKLMTVTLLSRRTPFVVTVLFAYRSFASEISSTMQMRPPAGDGPRGPARRLGAGGEQAVAHLPDSALMFKMFTLRNNAAGQPWLTGALCMAGPSRS